MRNGRWSNGVASNRTSELYGHKTRLGIPTKRTNNLKIDNSALPLIIAHHLVYISSSIPAKDTIPPAQKFTNTDQCKDRMKFIILMSLIYIQATMEICHSSRQQLRRTPGSGTFPCIVPTPDKETIHEKCIKKKHSSHLQGRRQKKQKISRRQPSRAYLRPSSS